MGCYHIETSPLIYRANQSTRFYMIMASVKRFVKFTGKHSCRNIFFYKVAGLMSAILLKNRLRHKYFPLNFEHYLSQNTSGGCLFISFTGYILSHFSALSMLFSGLGYTVFCEAKIERKLGVWIMEAKLPGKKYPI